MQEAAQRHCAASELGTTSASKSPGPHAPQVIESFSLCYAGRVTNKFGNGTGGALVADPIKGTAKVEIYAVTCRERAATDSFWGSALNHEILITPTPFGTRLEVNGSASTAAMNSTHQQVGRIVRGEARCEESRY
jgi:hypothetical protein